MGSSLVIGHKQVSSGELHEKHALGQVQDFQKTSDPTARLHLSTGTVTHAEAMAAAPAAPAGLAAPQAPAFTPIGIGKPLSVEILTVYTGNAPRKRIFGKKADLLVVSGVKAVETFNAQPKAINQLVPKAGDKDYLQASAFTEGSPIVYYSASMVNDTTLCSFQMAVDRFDTDIFDQLSGLFAGAAGLPIFAPQSTYLLAGSVLVKAASKLANSLIDRGPFLSADLDLRFDTPGVPISLARNAVLYDDDDAAELRNLDVRFNGGALKLVDPTTDTPYDGDAAYMIVSLDGRKRDNLAHFTPTVAEASLLEKFYSSSSPASAVVTALGSALLLYNDYDARTKAEGYKSQLDTLNQQIQALDPTAADYQTQLTSLTGNFDQLNTRYNAWRNRIQNSVLELPEVTIAGSSSNDTTDTDTNNTDTNN